ncbi:MAG: SDR family oxidoreductase [Gemmatimonadales bacterium]|nr:MAG: SDR family oxidoreductase [Gemmatimonadales bacterium]
MEEAKVSGGARGVAGGGLEGRVVLVTGGSGGLGRAVVRSFAEAGADVHVPIFDAGEVAGIEAYLDRHLEGGMRGVRLHHDVDLTRAASVGALFDRLPDVQVVANLAGGFAMSPVGETDPETWDRMLRLNATTAFLVSRAAFPAMQRAGFGRILNVSAFPALDRGAAQMTAYGAAKAAVLNLTQALAREGAAHGITANAILPSVIDTEANRGDMPDADRSKWLAPEEIAAVLRFLASDEAAIVNGAAIPLTRDG